jgi:hypothetical protein
MMTSYSVLGTLASKPALAEGSLSCAQLLSFRAKDCAVGLLIVVGSGRGHKISDATMTP